MKNLSSIFKEDVPALFGMLKKKARDFYYDFPTILTKWWEKTKKKELFQLVEILLVVALASFFYSFIRNYLTVPLGGDFTLQGMTFLYNGYDDWHTFFATGVFPQWDTSGFLGVSNISANSFYYLFDPFFLVMLIFPRGWLNQIQAIMTMVKLILAGIFFFLYLSEFNISSRVKKMGAVAYAFCGWMMYYLWFFHFQEIATVLPLMLLGVEKIIKKRDPRMMIFSLFFMGLINYFFFFSMTLLCFFYALFRFVQTLKNRKADENWAVIGCGFISFFTGILLSCAILVPCVLADLKMPRAADASYLTTLFSLEGIGAKLKYLFTWESHGEYKIYYPLASLLYLNDNCFSEALFPTNGYDNVGSSMYIFMPLTLMIFPSLVDAVKKKQYSQVLAFIIVGIMLFTPFTYYLLHAFVQAYGRWEIFVVALLILFVCLHFDEVKKLPRYVLDISFLLILALSIFVAYIALKIPGDYGGLREMSDLEKAIIPCQLVWTSAIYVVMRLRMSKADFSKDMIYVVGLEAIIMANVTIQGQGYVSYKNLYGGEEGARYQTNLVEKLQTYDSSFYRIFNSQADRANNNLAMREGYNGISTFHSVYNFDTKDLIDWSRISYTYGNWSMGVHEKRYNLDSLLGVKYYLLKKDDTNIPYGYKDVAFDLSFPESIRNLLYPNNSQSNYKLYLNTNFIDTFFVYDNYLTSDYFGSYGYENNNEINYLKSAIIDESYFKENTEVFSPFTKDNKKTMERVNSSFGKNETIYYRTNWNSKENGDGGYRKYSATMSDEEYLAQNPSTDTSIDYLTDKYFFISPGDTKGNPYEVVSYHNGEATDNENNSAKGEIQKGLTFNSKLVYTPSTPLCEEAASRGGAYLSIMSLFGYNIDYYLYDKDGEVITHDIHMWNGYSKNSDWKYARGFYVDRPVAKVVGLIKDNLVNTSSEIEVPFYQYEYNDEYQADIDRLKEENKNISITSRSTDSIAFTSSFEDSKLVVTNIPYEEGWSLEVSYKENDLLKKEKLDIIKTQGGLVGFVAPKGETSYILNYQTPGLNFGFVLTSSGLSISAMLFAIYFTASRYDKMLKQFYKSLSRDGL